MISFLQNALSFIVPAVLVLTIVVTVHEFGHFLAARLCGVKVDRFSIGFGKPILSHTDRSGVEWRLGWAPLGGYVRFAGDESAASVPDHEDLKQLRAEVTAREGEAGLNQYFHFKPVWQRAIVVAAGPFANFVLSSLLFAIVLLWVGVVTAPVRVTSIEPNSPAARAGFLPNDVILRADNTELDNGSDLQRYVALRADLPITFTIRRGEQELVLNAVPATVSVKDRLGVYNKIGQLGVGMTETRGDRQYRDVGVGEALVGGVAQTWEVVTVTTGYLVRLIKGEVPADQLGGVLRIGHTAGGVAKAAVEDGRNLNEQIQGVVFNLVQITALISVSIGFMNLLPVPVLDGGHLLFYAYEAVARRPLAAKVQDAGYRLGLALLLGLMLFATWNDFQNLRLFQRLGDLVS